MVGLADVRRWDPDAVEDVHTALGRLRDGLLDRDADLTAARPPDDWLGAASDAARDEQERLAERLRRVTAGITAVRPAVAGAADAVVALRHDLAAADGLAAARGSAIAEDGTVTDVRQTVVPADRMALHQQDRAADQAEIVAQLDAVLRRAAAVDAELADLLARAAAEQIDDGAATTLADAAAPAERQAALFRSLTGHDPVTDEDRRVAATLDVQSTVPPANLVVARIEPVPGAGLVYGGAFIAGPSVFAGGIPEWTNLGDDRDFDPNAGPERNRMAFLIDYENGLVVVRQNPSRSTDGTAETGVPEVGVEQGSGGAIRLRLEGADPLTLGITQELGWSVRGDVIVDPSGGPHDTPSVDGTVGQYPSWEAYHSQTGEPPTTVLQRFQNEGGVLGPAINLPWHGDDVGQQPERLDEWRQRHHPDQAGSAALEDYLDDHVIGNPFREVQDPFYDYPLPPVPAPATDGSGGLSAPMATRVG